MPAVSIIVPVYNVKKYLRRCIDSILAQTFTDIEVLLVDDGSTDGSGAICDEYAQRDNRVRVFHKKNGGVSMARNLGLDKATGKWVMFVDSDDEVTPQICERLLLHATERCMPMCMWREGTEDDYVLVDSVIKGSVAHPIREILRIKYHHPWDKIYERAIIEKAHLRFKEDISYMEDAIFCFEYYCYLESFVVVNEQLYFHRSLPNSLSHDRFIPNYEETLKCYYNGKERLAKCISCWDENYQKMMYSDYLVSYSKVFDNNMRRDAPGALRQKMQRNNGILRCEEFMKVYPYRYERTKDFTKRYIRMLEISYCTGSYFWLWMLGVSGKIKEAIKERDNQ